MTWWSEHSAVPRFVLANSAIRCRFVDRFAGSRVPSRVSIQRFSAHGAPLPSAGSRRARFPAFTGHMRALRLPARASGSLICSVAGPTRSSLRSCSPRRSRDTWRTLPGPGTCLLAGVPLSGSSRPRTRARSHRFPGDPSHASALLLDPGRADETSPLAVPSTPPPVFQHRRPQLGPRYWGSLTRLQHPPSTLHVRVAASVQDWLPAGGLRLCREGVEPSGSLRKVSGHIDIPLSRS